ncbi:hypothetical protein AeMF1_020502 [Aphanomyces euteiches]|nr:hypothetical protein AeMF1_020502 [Aphanomyces euteiches]
MLISSDLPHLKPIAEESSDASEDDNMTCSVILPHQSERDAIDPLSDVSTGLFISEGAVPPTSVVASVESFTTNPATPDAVPNEPKTPGPNESESDGFLPTPTSFTPGSRGPNPLSKSSQSQFVSAPVFTPGQIEAIMAGDFEGMVETPDVDIEDKMIPVSASDIKYLLRKISDRRKDPKHEDLANVIMKTLTRNLTDEERLPWKLRTLWTIRIDGCNGLKRLSIRAKKPDVLREIFRVIRTRSARYCGCYTLFYSPSNSAPGCGSCE